MNKVYHYACAIVMAASIPLSGCGQTASPANPPANTSQARVNTASSVQNLAGYRVSPDIARRVAQISGVRDSIVIVRGNTAYVTLDLARPLPGRTTAEDLRGANPDYTIRGAAGGVPSGTVQPTNRTTVTNGVGSAASGVAGGVGTAASGVGSGVSGAAAGVGTGLGTAATGVGTGVGTAVRSVGNGIGAAATGVGNGVGTAFSGVGNGAGGTAAGIGNGVGTAVRGIGNGVSGAATGVGNGVGTAVSSIGAGIGGALTGVAGGVGTAVSGVANGVGNAVTGNGAAPVAGTNSAIGVQSTGNGVNTVGVNPGGNALFRGWRGHYMTDSRGTVITHYGYQTGASNADGIRTQSTVDGDTSVSATLQQRVTDTVRQADPSIQTVYVTARPAAYAQFQSFNTPNPNGGTTVNDQYRTVIDRMFPTAR